MYFFNLILLYRHHVDQANKRKDVGCINVNAINILNLDLVYNLKQDAVICELRHSASDSAFGFGQRLVDPQH